MTECCATMQAQIDLVCATHSELSQCPDSIVAKLTLTEEPAPVYGLRVHDGGGSFLQIEFCPWCGRNLLPVMEKLEADLQALAHVRSLVAGLPGVDASDRE